MLIIWRKFVVWLRSLLLDVVFNRPIQWAKKLNELTAIINQVKPATPVASNTKKQPLRDFLRSLLK